MKNTYILSLLLSISFILPINGQQKTIITPCADTLFLELRSTDFPIQKNELPYYATTINIGKVSANENLKVSLDYPEFIPLKGKDLKWAKLHKEEIYDQIKLDTHLGFSRKDGYLDISFCPILKTDNRYMRLVSCKINISKIHSASALSSTLISCRDATQRWKQQSVLSQGKWAKIRVKKEGIYTLTPSFLSKMGFNNPEKVKLFGYGGRILEENWVFDRPGQVTDDLEEIPLYRKENGNALFFAEGTVRWTYNANKKKWIHENNPYSQYSYYFITEGESPAIFPLIKAEKKPTTQTDKIPYYSVLDHDAFGWYTGGREMYDEYDFAYGPTYTYKIKAESIDEKYSKNGNVDISFSASSTSSTTTVAISHNQNVLGNLSIPKYANFQSAYESRKSFNSSKISNENAFTFKVSPANPSRLNFIRINYTRILKATDSPYSFTPNSNTATEINILGASSQTKLWRIGRYGLTTGEIVSTLEGDILKAPIDEGKERYVILDLNTTYPSPEWDTSIENQNLHGDPNPYDMVILLPESRQWEEQAERLAEAHRKIQGLRVKIVDAGQIYNEFSSGTPDATAYRRYMKMLYDRAKTEKDMPRYLLLFGNCTWDNRMITSEYNGKSPKDYLLSFEVTDGFNNQNNTVFALGEQNSYVTDDYYGWLDDNEGNNYSRNKLDLSIGRLTCHNSATAKVLVDKCIAYMENKSTGAWKNTIYVLADNGNGNLHMNDAENVVRQIFESTGEKSVIKKVYNDAYTRVSTGTGHSFPTATKVLQDAMQQGALVFNYTGHGNPDQLSHAKILTTEDFERPTTNNLPLWIMASCEISPYDSERHDLGRAALSNAQGGAIAVMCASRAVYSNYNLALNLAYNKYLFSKDKEGKPNSMGDALRLTKVDLVTPSQYGGIKDGSINKLKYLLLGDPAITLSTPQGNVTIDSINGEVLDDSKRFQLKAGSLVHFSGHISDERNQTLSDFNGVITATMADRIEKIICKNNDGTADSPMVYEDRTKKIFEGSDSVKNGKFRITFRIPKDISYTTDSGRITFYAVNHENNLECHGANEQFYLNGTDTTYERDTLAPKVFVYLNNPDFPNGGVTSPNPIFFAKIKDDAGINATGVGIGHDMELVVDNNYSFPISLNNNFKYSFGSYQEGIVSYPLEGLDYGPHSISFKVWDVNGNSTTSKLQFNIQDGVKQDFDVYATENPAKSQTDLVVTLPHQEEDAKTSEVRSALFEVYNLSGQKIWESELIKINSGFGYGITTWHLNTNGGGKVPAGIYLYRVKVEGTNQKFESKAKKIIVIEQ